MSLDEHKKNVSFLIIGGGAWGLSLANTVSNTNSKVFLWDGDRKLLDSLKKNRRHPFFCTDIEIHENIEIVIELIECKYDAIFFVTPFQALEAVVQLILDKRITADHYVCASKGIDINNLQLAHEIMKPLLLKAASFVQLSGPSFAYEVMQGLPTAVTVGYKGRNVTKFFKNYVHQSNFRTYLTEDYIGVEIGGALKNVIAIGVGIADGLELGANARVALIVRGLKEIRTFGLSRGAESTTFSGLSGLGDLVLTATDNQSRNRQLGLKIAEFNNVHKALESVGKLVEGYKTSQALDRSKEINSENYPIMHEIIEIVLHSRKPAEALARLLSRELRPE